MSNMRTPSCGSHIRRALVSVIPHRPKVWILGQNDRFMVSTALSPYILIGESLGRMTLARVKVVYFSGVCDVPSDSRSGSCVGRS